MLAELSILQFAVGQFFHLHGVEKTFFKAPVENFEEYWLSHEPCGHIKQGPYIIPETSELLLLIAHPSLRKLPPAQEKYNFAIVTEHCCEVEAAEFEANLKKLDFIENYEVKWIALVLKNIF